MFLKSLFIIRFYIMQSNVAKKNINIGEKIKINILISLKPEYLKNISEKTTIENDIQNKKILILK